MTIETIKPFLTFLDDARGVIRSNHDEFSMRFRPSELVGPVCALSAFSGNGVEVVFWGHSGNPAENAMVVVSWESFLPFYNEHKQAKVA